MSKLEVDDEAIGSGIRRRINRMSPPVAAPSAVLARTRPPGKRSVTIRPRRTASLGLALVAVIAVAGCLVFRAVALTGQPSQAGLRSSASQDGTSPSSALVLTIPSSAVEPSSSSSAVEPSSSSSAVDLATIKLPGPVFDLSYDQARDSLWYAYLAPNQPALYQYNLASGKTAQWPLPPGDDSGVLDRVVLAPDGSVWVATAYRVARVDPVTGSVLTYTFPLADPDANSAALDPNALSPGTWISAITFDGADVALIARHNVTSLVGLDASLNLVDRIPMPASMVGPGDLAYSNGVIYAAPFHGSGPGILFSEQGVLVGTTTQLVDGFSVSGSTVAAMGPDGLYRVGSDASTTPWGPANQGGSPFDRFVLTAGGAAVYRYSPGLVEWITPDGGVDGRLALPSVQLMVTNPLGGTVPAYQQDQVGAIASDATGSIWYVDISSSELINVHL